MNEIAKVRPRVLQTTQGAAGMPRYSWSLSQFDKLVEHGFIQESDRVELIGGELVPMSPKGNRHEVVRDELLNWMSRRLPEGVRVSSELGWRPAEDMYLEPDLMVRPATGPGVTASGADLWLVIEVSDSSLRFDAGAKAMIYASLGVREYWVVDANSLETTVHLGPSAEGYANVSTYPGSATLTPTLAPALALSLGGLEIG